jgi:hypothetical protein
MDGQVRWLDYEASLARREIGREFGTAKSAHKLAKL